MDLPPSVVDIDSEDTWPEAAVCLLRQAAPVLDEFEAAERRDVHIRDGNSNCRWQRLDVISKLNQIFADCWLVGYHCTRMTVSEIDALSTVGMQPLSLELVHRRIAQAIDRGDICPSLGKVLLDKNDVIPKAGERLNMLWLNFSRVGLRNECGLNALFEYWGVEALYWNQSKKKKVLRKLAEVGRPCIVEMIVPVSGLSWGPGPFSERMLKHHRRRPTDDESIVGFDGFVRQAVPPDLVRKVIVDGTDEFEDLTRRSSWAPLDGTL